MLAARRSTLSTVRSAALAPSANVLLFQQQQRRSINHLEKNRQLGRPVSPHVTIYAFPLAAISSVMHRITGGLLTVGMYGVGIGALAGMDVGSAMATLGQTGVGSLAKFAVAFPLVFHSIGGVRHLYWEHYPEGLHQSTQKTASIIVIGSSTAISLAAALV